MKLYEDDVDNMFHPTGTNANSIIVHELGHALNDYITLNNLFLPESNTIFLRILLINLFNLTIENLA